MSSSRSNRASRSRVAREWLAQYQKTGVIADPELARLGQVPGLERLKKGPVAVVECVERIPCNPCAYACPRKAIAIEGDLTELPRIDHEKCNGCAVCVARCPGLAIFVVDCTFSKTEASVALPYELLPRPQKGQKVAALDRAGQKVATGTVVKVLDARAMDRCAVVTVAVPKRLWNVVRGIRVAGSGPNTKARRREGSRTGRGPTTKTQRHKGSGTGAGWNTKTQRTPRVGHRNRNLTTNTQRLEGSDRTGRNTKTQRTQRAASRVRRDR